MVVHKTLDHWPWEFTVLLKFLDLPTNTNPIS
jgi:hypothetical protein